jgi:hypothetical protein
LHLALAASHCGGRQPPRHGVPSSFFYSDACSRRCGVDSSGKRSWALRPDLFRPNFFCWAQPTLYHPLSGPAHSLSGSAHGYSHHTFRSPTRQRPSAGHIGPAAERARGTRGSEPYRLSSAHAAAVPAPSPNQTTHHEPSVSYGLPENPSPSPLSRGSRRTKKNPRGPEEDLGRRWRPPRQPEVNAPLLPLHPSPDRWRCSRGIRFGIPRCGRGLDLGSLFLAGRSVGGSGCGRHGFCLGSVWPKSKLLSLLHVVDACANEGSGDLGQRSGRNFPTSR